MYRQLLPVAAALAGLIGFASAQVTTACNPLNTTDCPADPAFGTDYTFHFNATPNGQLMGPSSGSIDYDPDKGAVFTINKQGDSPTLRTNFYFFFGRTEIWLQASPGQGIVSAVTWLSDDLDEVDWEFLGTIGNASTNYFGKGVQNFTNGATFVMADDPHTDYHNYTTTWTKDSLDWWIDGNLVRSLTPAEANNTDNYPQTPMRMSIGIWAGGDPTLPAGTREWAGGDTDYSAGPYTMYVKSAQVTDYSSGKEYTYGDETGSWQSIKVVDGNSTAVDTINQKPSESVSQKFNDLSSTAKIAIYAGGGAVGAILLGALIFYCIRQRRRGAQEAKLADDRIRAERMENERFKREGIDPDSFKEDGQEYDAYEMKKDGLVNGNAYSVPSTPSSPGAEKAWAVGAGGAAAAAAGGMGGPRSPPASLRREGTQNSMNSLRSSPAFHDARSGARPPLSPQHSTFGGPPSASPLRSPSPAIARSQSPMMHPQSPGMPPQGALPAAPYNRMASPGPQRMQSPAPMGSPRGVPQRMASPGPRMQSPAPMGSPRSFSESQQAYGSLRMQTSSPMAPARNFSTGQPAYRGAPSGDDYWSQGSQGNQGGYR